MFWGRKVKRQGCRIKNIQSVSDCIDNQILEPQNDVWGRTECQLTLTLTLTLDVILKTVNFDSKSSKDHQTIGIEMLTLANLRAERSKYV